MKKNIILVNKLSKKIQKMILKDYPQLTKNDYIGLDKALDYRLKAIENTLEKDNEKIKVIDKEIIDSIKNEELIMNESLTIEKERLGQRIADKIARFGGGWTFIITFISIIIIWIIINTYILLTDSFDPYPFTLLNLVLSCLAAIQAPIIMMSQNRQEERDRLQSKDDYKINLKSEIEVRLLHEKINHLIYNQMSQLEEIQDIQISLLNELRDEIYELKK